MTVQMQSIQVYSPVTRGGLRGVPATEGTRCHGCPLFEVIPTKKRTEPYRFWCNHRHRRVDPQAVECAGPPTARQTPHFHEWMARRMDALGIDRRQLAKMTGTKLKTMDNYALGRTKPKTPTRRRIYTVLGVWPGEPDKTLGSAPSGVVNFGHGEE